MSAPEAPRRVLPAQPSHEFLSKEAKRLAKAEALRLAAAQLKLAQEYGFKTWAALLKAAAPVRNVSALSRAAARADLAEVRALLAAGAPVDGAADESDTPLFCVCASSAPAADRLAVAGVLIEAGAFTRRGCTGGATPLHAAARRGPASLVRLLLKNGALFWQGDDKNARPHDYAKSGTPEDREEILYLLADGPRIEDQGFRDAVSAIQAGDIAVLCRLLDARPALLRERAIEPEIGPRGYFTDPMLFWFVANNPTLVPKSSDNIVEITNEMIARGVAQSDLDYAFELVATNAMMPEAQQVAMVAALVEGGAKPTARGMLSALGHARQAPSEWLVANRIIPLDATIAAGLGRMAELPALIASAGAQELNDALAMAVINRQRGAARLCLGAGADPNQFMPCHTHSTPLHQAALDGELEIMRDLLMHGARTDTQDKMWRGTPLGWALHGRQAAAAALLREAG